MSDLEKALEQTSFEIGQKPPEDETPEESVRIIEEWLERRGIDADEFRNLAAEECLLLIRHGVETGAGAVDLASLVATAQCNGFIWGVTYQERRSQ